MKYLQNISIYAIGIVFLLSAIGKAWNVLYFQSILHSYGFPYLDLIAPLIIIVELVVAFLFLVKWRVKTLSMCSIVMLLLFTAVYLYGYYKQGVSDCGCFGVITLQSTSPLFVFARNILLIILANIIYFTKDNETEKWTNARWVIFCVLVALLTFRIGLTFRPTIFLPSPKHPLEGKSVLETSLGKYIPHDKSTLLLCYGYECSHCMNTMENFLAVQRYGITDTIIAIATIRENAEIDSLRRKFHEYYPHIGTQEINIDSIPEITLFPTSLLIENDTIRQVLEGELPSPYFIKNE
jgi:hypothetical protein